ncbi:MAG: UMP kinase [Candidatus Thorarchaeota archaeon]|nr:UMP kinase [Candidatus Thorarchaeota archaeon]
MRAVIKIGGSLLYDDTGQLIVDRVREYARELSTLHRNGHQLVVVVGGGRPARSFISAARQLGASEVQADWLGIKIARHNAELLMSALPDDAYPRAVETLEELEIAVCTGRVVLMGGLTPGQSTNAVAALAAEAIRADWLLNATNVEGVFDRDPSEPGARKLDQVSIVELQGILSGSGTRAGEYKLFDPVAISIVARSRIPTVILDGRTPKNIVRVLSGEKVGSVIVHG